MTTLCEASSRDAFFPESNIQNPLRAKDWRSAGFYRVAGSSIVVDGAYSRAQLLAELNEWDEDILFRFNGRTGRFEIESDDVFSIDDPILEILGFDEPLSGESEYQGARIAIHTEEFLIFDMKTPVTIDTVALLWQKPKILLSPLAEIRLEANPTPDFSAPVFSTVLERDERIDVISKGFSAQHYRYWRIVIVDPENANLYVSLGTVVLGQADDVLVVVENGFQFGINDATTRSRTLYGQGYFDVYPQMKSLQLRFDLMELAESERLIEMFAAVGKSRPVYIELDPLEKALSKEFWIYGTVANDVGLGHVSLAYFGSSLQIEEIN